MNAPTDVQALKPKDFATDQEVRWCPGCGDYAILKGVQAALAQMGARPENTVFVSGIGCSSRFPYYMETYGFHTIHGRAPAIATGVKLANPELDVWVITGDGDGLSIGGNHLLHILRRNVDLQILLFNNEIYGLTKGQYSPTSRIGTRSPSTPLGSVDRPLLPVRFALGAGASFVARAVDTHVKNLPGLLARAKQHKGTSFIEIYQNCLVYNDDVFADFTDREVADARQVHVEHGKPLIFGKERDKGIRLKRAGLSLRWLRSAVMSVKATSSSTTRPTPFSPACWPKCLRLRCRLRLAYCIANHRRPLARRCRAKLTSPATQLGSMISTSCSGPATPGPSTAEQDLCAIRSGTAGRIVVAHAAGQTRRISCWKCGEIRCLCVSRSSVRVRAPFTPPKRWSNPVRRWKSTFWNAYRRRSA